MPQITIQIGDEKHRVTFERGPTVRDLQEEAGYRVRTGCRGHGTCGLCEVRLRAGLTNEPTINERLHIMPERLTQGVRLACQMRPLADLHVEILHPAPPTDWQSLPVSGPDSPGWILNRPRGWPAEVHRPLGVAVDLGTNCIRLSLFRLGDGQCLARRRGPNA